MEAIIENLEYEPVDDEGPDITGKYARARFRAGYL